MKKQLSDREIRRRRRIRSQCMAYTVLVLLLILVGTGVYYGVDVVTEQVMSYQEKVDDAMEEAQSRVEEDASESLFEETQVAETQSTEMEQETQTTPQEETTDPLDELVDALLADMPIEDKVAGLFVVSPEAITGVGTAIQAGDSTKNALEENPVGGLIYADKNIKSDEQFLEMLTNTRSYSKYPLFLAVSKEAGAYETPRASELADMTAASEAYTTIAQKLQTYGINMNLAPVADIVSENGNSDLQGRTFGSDASAATTRVNAAISALDEYGINAVLLTFPGEGSIDSNRNITKSLEEFKNSEFITYQAAITAGVDCVMVSSLTASALTGDETPCTLSTTVITKILREQFGFEGVVVTDYLNSAEITSRYSSADAVIKALEAGADVLLEPKNYKEAYQAVLDAVNNGTISQERINESLHRIYRVKYQDALDE